MSYSSAGLPVECGAPQQLDVISCHQPRFRFHDMITKHKLLKRQLLVRSKYIDPARIDPLIYLHYVRYHLPDVYKRDRQAAHRQRSAPLPLP